MIHFLSLEANFSCVFFEDKDFNHERLIYVKNTKKINVFTYFDFEKALFTLCIVRSNLAMHLLDTPFTIWQPIWRPHLLERICKPIRTLHWCRVLPLKAQEGVIRERGKCLPTCCNCSANKGLLYIIL